MGLWTCPDHGLTGPVGCCPKASFAHIVFSQSTAREMCSGDLCDGLSYDELAACFANETGAEATYYHDLEMPTPDVVERYQRMETALHAIESALTKPMFSRSAVLALARTGLGSYGGEKHGQD